MIPVECSRGDVVEAVVIDPRQPVGPIGVGPDPGLEGALDLVQLFLGGLGVDDVEDALFAVAIDDGVEDLWDGGIECVRQELAGVPAIGTPFGGAGGGPAKLAGLDSPGRQFRHVVDLDLGVHRLLDEGDDVGRRYPGRTEPGGDVGWSQVSGLHSLQRGDVPSEDGIERRGGFSQRLAWIARRRRDKRPRSAMSHRRGRERSYRPVRQ